MTNKPKTSTVSSVVSRRSVLQASAKAMFMWVAGASIIIVTITVLMFYVYKQFKFNNQVISKESTAANTLKKNAQVYDDLKKNVDALSIDESLAASRSPQSTDNLQVITDALATSPDVSTFAASLQNIITPKSGVTLESVTIPADSEELLSAGSTQTPDGTNQPTAGELQYQVEVIGNYESITTFLQNLEKTIRPVDVKSVELSGSDSVLRATVTMTTYYQPVKDIQITKKEISLQ